MRERELVIVKIFRNQEQVIRRRLLKMTNPLLPINSKNASRLRILGSVAASGKGLRASTLMISSGDHHVKLGEYAAKLYKDRSMTDVMVVVQSREFKAHKAVLACYSPYFDEVLNKPGFNKVHYLQMPGITAKAFEILLDYIYTGELKVTCQELLEVYRAAKKLGIEGAVTKCTNLLQVSEENIQNMVYLYVTSKKLDLLDATVRSFSLMVQNFEKLITTKEFLDLEVEHIIELFSSDKLGARSETIVFIAALKWLDYDFFEREEHAEKVFDCVRFPLMTVDEIIACYHPPLLPGLMLLPKIQEALMKANCYITAKSLGQEALFSELACVPRNFLFGGEPMVLWDLSMFEEHKYKETKEGLAATKIQSLFRGYITRKRLKEEIRIANYSATIIQSAYRGYRVRKSLQQKKSAMKWKGKSPKNYLIRTDVRSGIPKAYTKRSFQTVYAASEETKKTVSIYAMGAFDAEKSEANSILQFDATEKSWKFLSRCVAPRYDARMVYLDGYLYIIGGFRPATPSETGVTLPTGECHRYHLETDEWREMPQMNVSRCSHAAAIFNGEILAIGGKNDQNMILRSIERYDMLVGRWKDFSRYLPEPRMAMGCTIHKGELWIAGGITTDGKSIFLLDTVWCLDMFLRWNKETNLPQALAFPKLTSNGKHLYCLGGASRAISSEREDLESVDKIYKLVNKKWIEQISMPFGCHNVIACNADNLLYLFGGFSSHSMSQIQEPLVIDFEEDVSQTFTFPEEAAGSIVEATAIFQKQN